MRILLIGGTGLISSAITQELLRQGGHEIVHFNRGKRAAAPEGVTQLTGDRKDFAAFEKQMAEAVRRIVPNLEAQGRIASSDDPALAWYDGVLEVWDRHGAGIAEELRAGFPDAAD